MCKTEKWTAFLFFNKINVQYWLNLSFQLFSAWFSISQFHNHVQNRSKAQLQWWAAVFWKHGKVRFLLFLITYTRFLCIITFFSKLRPANTAMAKHFAHETCLLSINIVYEIKPLIHLAECHINFKNIKDTVRNLFLEWRTKQLDIKSKSTEIKNLHKDLESIAKVPNFYLMILHYG